MRTVGIYRSPGGKQRQQLQQEQLMTHRAHTIRLLLPLVLEV